MKIDKLNNNFFYNITFVLFVSIIIVLLSKNSINRDGVLYLYQSKLISSGNFTEALSIYNWPFYSFLISKIHGVTKLPYLQSAHMVNIGLFLIAFGFYLKIISLISNTKIPIIFGTLIIISSFSIMDDYLIMILRDHGSWAGFMMGVYFYLKWLNIHNLRYAILWQLGFTIAALFRIECIVFNFLLPFTHQFFILKNRFIIFIQSISLFLIYLLILLIVIFSNIINLQDINNLRFIEIVDRPLLFLTNFWIPFDLKTSNFFLNHLFEEFSLSLKYIFLFYVLFYKWITGAGIFHLSLFFVCIRKVDLNNYFKPLSIIFTISFVIPLIHLLSTYILTGRYLVINWWIVYVYSAFGASYIWNYLPKLKCINVKVSKIIYLAIFFSLFINIFYDKNYYDKDYQVAQWIKDNELNVNKMFIASDRIRFYLDSDNFMYNINNSDMLNNFDYEYIVIDAKKETSSFAINKFQPVKYFPNEEKAKTIVYKRLKNND